MPRQHCLCLHNKIVGYLINAKMLEKGKRGEILIHNRLDGWYIKVGARLVGNQTLVDEVQALKKRTRNGKLGQMALGPEHMPDVLEGLEAVANLGEVGALVRFVYPEFGQQHIENLTQ